MPKIKLSQCPSCGAVWDMEEIEDHECAACGWPDEDEEKEFDPDDLED